MGTATEMVVSVKLGATQPADNIHCDVNHPLWHVAISRPRALTSC
jgi:hypothetical protein